MPALTNAQLNAFADQLEQIAKAIRPIVAPAVRFQDRSTMDASIWRTVFEDDFDVLAAPGEFLSTYKTWNAYPNNYVVTDKIGRYEPKNLSVIDADGYRVMNCALITGKQPLGCAPYPRFPGQNDASARDGMRVEMRVRITKPVPGWHAANLLWPDSEQWPRDGEIDFLEFDFSETIGAFLHRQNGTNGGDQDAFSSGMKPTGWFTVGFEWVAGKSFKWFLNGTQMGKTITKRVPASPMHLVLQNESYGRPSADSAIQYDWVTCAVPA